MWIGSRSSGICSQTARSEHVSDFLTPGNDSPVPNGQAIFGFQNWSTWFGKERGLWPQPGIEPCFLKYSDPIYSIQDFIVGCISPWRYSAIFLIGFCRSATGKPNYALWRNGADCSTAVNFRLINTLNIWLWMKYNAL